MWDFKQTHFNENRIQAILHNHIKTKIKSQNYGH